MVIIRFFFFIVILASSPAFSADNLLNNHITGKQNKKVKEVKKKTVEELLKEIKSNPKNIVAHRNLGIEYVKEKDFYKAISEFSEIIQIDSNHLESYYFLGNLYKKTNHRDMAIWGFKEVLRLKPEDANVHYELVTLYLEKGFINEAIKQYKKIVEIMPDDPNVHYSLGVIYARNSMKFLNDELEEAQSSWFVDYSNLAIEQFKKTIEIKPDHANAHFNLGVSYMYMNWSDLAKKVHADLKNLDSELAEKLNKMIKDNSGK